jgi:hypothetical protein
MEISGNYFTPEHSRSFPEKFLRYVLLLAFAISTPALSGESIKPINTQHASIVEMSLPLVPKPPWPKGEECGMAKVLTN